jgi:hypothetical protein
MSKKSKLTAAEEARNEAMRETLRFILKRDKRAATSPTRTKHVSARVYVLAMTDTVQFEGKGRYHAPKRRRHRDDRGVLGPRIVKQHPEVHTPRAG